MVRQEDDWTNIGVSLCAEHKKSIQAGELLVDRRTAQGRLEVLPGPHVVARS